MSRLSDKAIIVTGAAAGIGLGIAAACRHQGAAVVMVDKDPAVEDAARDIGAIPLVADVTAPDSAQRAMDAALRHFGRLDGLVNNAGRVDEADILETSADLWRETMALNLDAPYLWSQAAIPLMLKAGGGAIVNISTIEATHVRPRHFPYVVSKSGLNCLTRAIAVDFGRRGIRCNTLSPGSIDTPMYDRYTALYPGLREHLIGLNYAGRLGTVEEIGAAAVYLLSDETPFLNGHELVIDGARTVAT
ncbi:MAG: SDR family oxidoreductase [Pseudomonadota bacterium]|nr:SDR family oxidoreductase [Pseudomonadota bacterium]